MSEEKKSSCNGGEISWWEEFDAAPDCELPAGSLKWDGHSPEWEEMARAINRTDNALTPNDDAGRATCHGLTVAQFKECRAKLAKEPHSEELLAWAAQVRRGAIAIPRKLKEIFPPIEERTVSLLVPPKPSPRMWTLANGNEANSVMLGLMLHDEWRRGYIGVVSDKPIFYSINMTPCGGSKGGKKGTKGSKGTKKPKGGK